MAYAKLRGRIVEKYGNQKNFAKAMGVSLVTVSYWLNCHKEWTEPRVTQACKLLDIPLDKVGEYFTIFFANKVEKKYTTPR